MRITPPFSLWNRITIKLANKIYQKLISYKKESTTEDFKDVIFPFAGKEIYFDFYQRASEKPVYRILKSLKPKNYNERFFIKDKHGNILEKSNNLLSLIEKTKWNNLRAVK